MNTETLDLNEPANLFLKLAQPCDKPCWKNVRRIKGKGSQTFLKTLSRAHCTNGRSSTTRYRTNEWGVFQEYRGYNYHRIVSHVAVSVWESPEQRRQWLTYHKATSRLVGNS
jgi:hypothetical protein